MQSIKPIGTPIPTIIIHQNNIQQDGSYFPFDRKYRLGFQKIPIRLQIFISEKKRVVRRFDKQDLIVVKTEKFSYQF